MGKNENKMRKEMT